MYRIIFMTICFLGIASFSHGQSKAKFNLKGGVSIFRYADEDGILEDKSHTSHHVGFDVLIEKNQWLFMPGFHYYRIGIKAEDFSTGELFLDRPYLHYAKMPLSAGYHFKMTPVISLSAYAGTNLNFFISVDDNDAGIANNQLKGVQVNGHIGAQALILSHITLDMRYEKGFLPAYKARDMSKIKGFSLSLGFII